MHANTLTMKVCNASASPRWAALSSGTASGEEVIFIADA